MATHLNPLAHSRSLPASARRFAGLLWTARWKDTFLSCAPSGKQQIQVCLHVHNRALLRESGAGCLERQRGKSRSGFASSRPSSNRKRKYVVLELPSECLLIALSYSMYATAISSSDAGFGSRPASLLIFAVTELL